jgi:hypothetical protein
MMQSRRMMAVGGIVLVMASSAGLTGPPVLPDHRLSEDFTLP